MFRFGQWMAAALLAVFALGAALPQPARAQVRTLKAVSLAGKRYVALKDLAAMYGLPLVRQGGKAHLIRGQNVSLLFTENQRKAVINGTVVWLHAPLTPIKGNWYVSDADAQYVIDPLVRPSAYLGGRGTQTVVLDAGHGGKDPGCHSAAGQQEKDTALDIALRVRAHLQVAGLRVILTRSGDRFLELEDRPRMAAKQKGDLFVSIHLNATANTSVSGVETFATAAENYPATADSAPGALAKKHAAEPNNKYNHSSTALVNQIQKALVGVTRAEDRGVKRARFVVIRESPMPAALVECGFLTNAAEAKKLTTPAYRETVARGIAQGILNYIALVNRAKKELGAPVVQTPVPALLPATRLPAAAPAPAAPQPPTPMAARSFALPQQPQPAARPAPAPVPAPAAAPAVPAAAPTPAAVPRPAAAPRPVPVLSVPAPPAPAYPPVPIAPPPNNLLNPGLATRPAPSTGD